MAPLLVIALVIAIFGSVTIHEGRFTNGISSPSDDELFLVNSNNDAGGGGDDNPKIPAAVIIRQKYFAGMRRPSGGDRIHGILYLLLYYRTPRKSF